MWRHLVTACYTAFYNFATRRGTPIQLVETSADATEGFGHLVRFSSALQTTIICHTNQDAGNLFTDLRPTDMGARWSGG